METYRNWDRDSSVVAYEIGDDFIIVQFRKGRFCHYTYTHSSAGFENVELMKQFASAGDGLGAYINEYRPQYYSRV